MVCVLLQIESEESYGLKTMQKTHKGNSENCPNDTRSDLEG